MKENLFSTKTRKFSSPEETKEKEIFPFRKQEVRLEPTLKDILSALETEILQIREEILRMRKPGAGS